jgi:hypothetical protein
MVVYVFILCINNNYYLKMSAFTPINYTMDLIKSFAINGDYEALSVIDFRDYPLASIDECISYLQKRMNNVNTASILYDNMCKCIDLLKQKVEEERFWETKDFIIYCHCYQYCIHKLKHKNTNTIHMVYSGDIKEILMNENIDIKHFA